MMRRLVFGMAALGLVVAAALPAAGHVTVSAQGEAVQGGFARLIFSVPNEQDDSATVGLEITFPEETPIANVSVQPKPGWSYQVQTATFDPPIDVHGEEVSEGVSSVTWTGGSIAPGEFDQFVISAGPLPEADELVFKAVQSYDNGDEVRWIEEVPESGEEPELPAPILTLTAASTDDEDGDGAEAAVDTSDLADASDVDSVRVLSIVAIVVGAIGILLGGFALARKRAA